MSDAEEGQTNRAVFLARCGDEVVRRYLTRLKRLRDEGFHVDVFAGAGEGIETLRQQGIDARPIPVRKSYNAAGLLGTYFIVQAYMLEKRPLLVHAFGHRMSWLSTFAARQADVPVVFVTFDFHWLEEEPFHLPLGPVALLGVPKAVAKAERGMNRLFGQSYRRAMHQAYRWLGEQVDRYVVTTEFDFQLLLDMDVVPKQKLEMAIGGAGVDTEEYGIEDEGGPDRQAARRRLGLPAHWRQVVGSVGPVTRRHGADDLVESIVKLKRTHPSVGWLVVGRRQMAGGQMRRLRKLERRGHVVVVEGNEPDADWYRAMDVLAWFGRPSTPHDAIGEAAALAVPTVGYETPAARSRVENGQTGHLLFEAENEAVIGVLGKMLDDPGYLRDMGLRAKTLVNLRFSRSAVDDQMVRMYDRILERNLS